MKIVFLSNFLNHHQKPLSDELYRLTDGQYTYIDTDPMPEERRKLGYKELDAPYLVKCYNQPTPPPAIQTMIDEADAVIIGSAPDAYIANRTKNHKLTFKYTERLYREEPGWMKLVWHKLRFKWRYDRNPHCCLLCASAFTAPDFRRIGCFKNRAFKWGYFPAVRVCNRMKNPEAPVRGVSRLKILWVARFLIWKHPELPVMIADRLKNDGIDFELNMYGIGPELDHTKTLIDEKRLNDRVFIRGSAPNDEILRQMSMHDIFLFTSDRNEGWGAVANEAMAAGCILVASDAIGSTPFLVKDHVNGLTFRSENADDLYAKVRYIIDHPDKRREMSENGMHTVQEIWNPGNAARNLMSLIRNFYNGRLTPAEEGPCSIAE